MSGMTQKLHDLISSVHNGTRQSRSEILELYPGIELSFLSISGNEPLHFSHEPMAGILEINYCISGRIGWNMSSGNQIYLGAGDFSLNRMDICANSTITVPGGSYEGIMLSIDLEQLSENPPPPLSETNITGESLVEKYCKGGMCTALVGNKAVQNIFEAFYQPPEELRLAYQKIKVLELLLVLSQLELRKETYVTEYRAEQVEIIRQIHDQLTEHLDQRCSIEVLSREFLMNPTTLKNMFKTIYGKSIAAHIREHRMDYAAQLLRSSSLSIADIALKVGYDSQSRFSSVFKNQYQMLPKDYRRKYSSTIPTGSGCSEIGN